MVLLESLDLEQGQIMPEFELQDPFGTQHSLSSLMGPKGLFIGFTCNHCPYAIAIWKRLIQLESNFSKLGIATVAINPNINPNYPDDSPAAMKKKIESYWNQVSDDEWEVEDRESVVDRFSDWINSQVDPDKKIKSAQKDGKLFIRIDELSSKYKKK